MLPCYHTFICTDCSKKNFWSVLVSIWKSQKMDFSLCFKNVILKWPKVFQEIDHGCFRVFGPYFIGKSPCTTCRLTFEFWSIIESHLRRLSEEFLRTFWRTSQDFLWNVWGLYADFLKTIWGLSQGFLRTIWGLYEDYMRNFGGLSQDY